MHDWPHAHVHQCYYELTESNQNIGHYYSEANRFKPVILIYANTHSTQFFFLAEGTIDSSDPWDYIEPGVKNQS